MSELVPIQSYGWNVSEWCKELLDVVVLVKDDEFVDINEGNPLVVWQEVRKGMGKGFGLAIAARAVELLVDAIPRDEGYIFIVGF